MNNKHFIDINDLSDEELFKLLKSAQDIMNNPSLHENACKNKLLCELFYEPSTRTALSFQAAMLRLGGKVFGITDMNTSSASKGETLSDTIQVVNSYSDLIVLRHQCDGASAAAANCSDIPIINAGDGGHLHPTQTLADLLLIYIEKERLDNLTIAICGDLKYGRTTHSLVKALCRFNNKFVFISSKELTMPIEIIELIKESNCEYQETDDLEAALPQLDLLYMTRIQQERFSEKEKLENNKIFILDNNNLKAAKKDMLIMHPLPRLNEIAPEVDNDKRAKYFKQAKCGLYVRMALIYELLFGDKADKSERNNKILNTEKKCENKKCITCNEKALPKYIFENNNLLYCYYCEKLI